jgi:hypothetical protein
MLFRMLKDVLLALLPPLFFVGLGILTVRLQRMLTRTDFDLCEVHCPVDKTRGAWPRIYTQKWNELETKKSNFLLSSTAHTQSSDNAPCSEPWSPQC